MPKNKYGNGLISNSIVMHYGHGIPLKRIEEMWGPNLVSGNLMKIFHRLADFWQPAIEPLKEEYRNAPVKHADETGWRCDGRGGYGWLFNNENISIFLFRETRSSSVVREILGKEKLPGVLIVDRYAGYNKSPRSIQYCYAHLLRNVEDLQKEFPEYVEIKRFVSCVIPLLSEVMHLRGQPIDDKTYYKEAKKLKRKIMKEMNASAKHPGIQKIQDIFRNHKDRLFHWVKDRRAPADNNRAERELRPTVIARKVSFGSQSRKGLKTRPTLMTILQTARKRLPDDKSLQEWFYSCLEKWIENPDVDPYSLLPTAT